jgi:hypothetical protein
MRRLALLVMFVAAGVGAGVARADQPPLDLAGQPFYFSATCTGIGDVILVNQSLARRPALRVVGTTTVVIPFFDARGAQTNGSCTFTGAGSTIETIEPFDEAFTSPVVIA